MNAKTALKYAIIGGVAYYAGMAASSVTGWTAGVKGIGAKVLGAAVGAAVASKFA